MIMNSQLEIRSRASTSQSIRLLYAAGNRVDTELAYTRFAECAPEFELMIVDSGAACLEQIRISPPDLLLLNHRLPDTNSEEMLDRLHHLTPLLPVVVVTGLGDEELVVRDLRLGVANYIPRNGNYLESLPGLLHDELFRHLRRQNLGLLAVTQRILYVEEVQNDVDCTVQHFAKVFPQFAVDTVSSCAKALKRLAQPAVYDLVLVNLRMPDQSGLDFVLEAQRRGLRLPPFIMITGEGDEKADITALKLGAADYIVKRKGYLNQLTYSIVRAIANSQISQLKAQLSDDKAELKRDEESLGAYQIKLEMQNNELRRIQGELDAVRARYFDLYYSAPVGYCTVTGDGLIQQANLAAIGMLGMSQGELSKLPFYRFILKEDLDSYYQLCRKILSSSEPQACDLRLVSNDGTPFWVQLTGTAQNDNGGAPVLRIVLTDVTERKQAEDKLQLAASVFSHAREGIMITTADGLIIDINDSFSRITGYSRDEVLGQNPRFLSSGRHEHEYFDSMWRELAEKGYWYGEIWNRHKNGELFAVMQTISAVGDARGKPRHFVSLFTDITALKEHEIELDHDAHYDALTNLPNRLLLGDRLQQGMVQNRRRGRLLAVAFLDLDGFKDINDEHGHEAGDQLLIALATRMKQTLREGDTLARMGGDEFVAILPDLADIEASLPMITRLLAAAAEPVEFGEITLQVSASLGVTFYSQTDNVDADQLLRQADQAMYQAKQSGRNRYHLFDPELDRDVRGRYESLDHIRQALNAEEFVLYYQPKVNMRTGAVTGAEALIRWQHPEKGLLSPMMFLPEVEDHSLAIEIGEWVIDAALAQMEIWQAAGLHIPVSVNIGGRQLQKIDFVERLRKILAAHPNVSPSCLKLEVIESSALKNVAVVSQVMETCREFGVLFAMDDFGTGYSSLTYLKQLPVDTIKIDQTFVQGMLNNKDDLSILKGVLSLSDAFHREVIAEGVETVEHGAMLLKLGCDLAQGFGIARPMPGHELPAWSAAWRPDPSWMDISKKH